MPPLQETITDTEFADQFLWHRHGDDRLRPTADDVRLCQIRQERPVLRAFLAAHFADFGTALPGWENRILIHLGIEPASKVDPLNNVSAASLTPGRQHHSHSLCGPIKMNQEITDAELAEIQHLLDTGYCNPVWRKHITSLLAEVKRLRQHSQNTEDLQRNPLLSKRVDFNDTVIL